MTMVMLGDSIDQPSLASSVQTISSVSCQGLYLGVWLHVG